MRVKLFDIDDSGRETFRCECDLDDCFDGGDGEASVAHAELSQIGRYWTGGGAAPLVLLMRVQP